MNKWKKAVIHLECATDSEHYSVKLERYNELSNKLREGQLTLQEYIMQSSGKTKDIRSAGTALFVEHENKKYLITARHVLWNEVSAEKTFACEIEKADQLPESIQDGQLENAKEKYQNEVFNMIFRVPSYDDILQGHMRDNAFLMNLGASPPSYTFSTPDLDIAIVSFSVRNNRFLNEIIRYGHEPISFDDIADEPTEEGAEVFTVGFPYSTSSFSRTDESEEELQWSSWHFSLPIFSFGRISMLHKELFWYWADMSVYPGNSGGPVIEDDKLVGIVSQQASIPVENSDELEVRIPFANIIKAKYVKELILNQQQKDTNIAKFYGIEKPLGI